VDRGRTALARRTDEDVGVVEHIKGNYAPHNYLLRSRFAEGFDGTLYAVAGLERAVGRTYHVCIRFVFERNYCTCVMFATWSVVGSGDDKRVFV
jgi:hypothetical protein